MPRPLPFPRPLTTFIGRDRERAELTALIGDGEIHLVTLVGPGGVGKTRLAVQVANDVWEDFALVGFASLAAVTDAALILQVAGEALGIREPSIERIAEQVAGRSALLVLDNLEQIPGAAAVISRLLSACPSLTVIATSRTVLRVSGERLFSVQPFETPEDNQADQLAALPAIQLFAARARTFDAGFSLDPATVSQVAHICRQVDGLPLAIELAAGQVRVLTLQEILARIGGRLDLLSHGPADQPERLQSLEQALRWSYDLLSPTEQRAIRQLGVFAGGFSEEAVQQVVLDGAPALPLLTTLIDASLVTRSIQPDGESRYALLETVRAFCQLELQTHGEADAARAAHAAYYLRFAAHAEPRLIVIGSAEWVRKLAVEYANLREAVEWALASSRPQPVLALAGTLLSMAYARGEPAESRSWLEDAVTLVGDEPTPLTSDALFTASALAQVQGEFQRSIEHATRSLEHARSAGYPFGEGRALLGLGIGAEWGHDLDLAEEHYRAARAIMQTIDPTTRRAHWLVLPVANLADIALIRGDYRRAIELGSEAVEAWRRDGYLWGTAQALGTVAAARCELRDRDGARRDYREALELWIACADGRGIAGTIAGIAALALHDGNLRGAATLLGAAWSVRDTLGLEFVAHHLYAEQVRAAVFSRSGLESPLAAAEEAGRSYTLEQAIASAQAVLEGSAGRTRPASSSLALSAREREVLSCVVEGMHDREIASYLSISPRTVQSHVLSILNKLGAHSRAEAVAIALRNGLI